MKSEPSLDSLIQAVLLIENLDAEKLLNWEKRIHRAAWLPTLYVGYDQQIKQTQSVSVGDTISVSSGIVTVGPDDTDVDYDNNTGQVFRVRAVWNLDALIFNKELLSLANERRDQLSLKLTLGEKIAKMMEQRYQALKLYFKYQAAAPEKAAEQAIRFTLLTEWLDQLSSRKFSARLFRIHSQRGEP